MAKEPKSMFWGKKSALIFFDAKAFIIVQSAAK